MKRWFGELIDAPGPSSASTKLERFVERVSGNEQQTTELVNRQVTIRQLLAELTVETRLWSRDIMLLTHPQIDSIEVPARRRGRFVLAARSGLYILLVLATSLSAGGYGLRKYGIFGCSASGYGSDGYLGYYGTTSYGDYDHGAFWSGLEPAAGAAAAKARVLFVGNSRTVFAFSGKPTADWFSSLSESYYLLGFTHFENYTFEAPLLRKLRPQAKVYGINIDSFFDQSETGPGKAVMEDESARARYNQKRGRQTIHKAICTTFKSACGHEWQPFGD